MSKKFQKIFVWMFDCFGKKFESINILWLYQAVSNQETASLELGEGLDYGA